MTDFIIVVILAVIVIAAARYVYKAKKSGAKCIGCSVGEGGCHCHETAESSDRGCNSKTGSCCCCQADAKS